MNKLRLLHDRIMVRPIKEEMITPAGIIILAGTQIDNYVRGEVVGVGSGTKDNDISVKVGEKILYYAHHAGEEIAINNESFVIIRDKDAIAVIE
jgi:chaperonin GroES